MPGRDPGAAGEEREALDGGMRELAAAIEGSNLAALRSQTEQLGRASEAFAARRMDRTIRTALTGVEVQSLEEQP